MTDQQHSRNLQFPAVAPWVVQMPPFDHAVKGHRQPDYHPANNPVAHNSPQAFQNTIFAPPVTTGQMTRDLMWARLLFNARNATERTLKRLADMRHPLLFENDIPARDGSNFQGTGPAEVLTKLRQMFKQLFSSHILTVDIPDQPIYVPARIDQVVDDTTRWPRFRANLLQHPTLLRQLEDQRMQLPGGGLRPHFQWLNDYETSLRDTLEELEAAHNWARAGHGTLDAAIASTVNDLPEMTRLISFILDRESTFYRVLTHEHVFGCLGDKRINLLSPKQLSVIFDIFLMTDTWFSPTPQRDNNYDFIYDRLDHIYSLMQNYQSGLRDMFDYRQLVEWGYKNIWRRLYVTVSPELGISTETVDEFLTWTTNDHATMNFFAVHPARTDQFTDEDCIICMDPLNAPQIQGTLIMELHCGHTFHPHCVLDSFDVFSHYTNRCPTCRHPAGSLQNMIQGYPIENPDVDYQVTNAASQLDLQYAGVIVDLINDGYFLSRNELHGVLDNAVHAGYWREKIFNHLATRRPRVPWVFDDPTIFGV